MAQVNLPSPSIPDASKDVWGKTLNPLLDALRAQGNATDAVISALVETVQDIVGAMFVGSGITFTYDDASGKINVTVNTGTPPAALVNSSLPTISGTPQVGSTLTASTGVWSPAPDSASVQWRRNDVPIPYATGATYTVTSADIGAQLKFVVTVSKSGYADTYLASSTVTATAAPTSTSYLLTEAGDVLTTEAGDRLVLA